MKLWLLKRRDDLPYGDDPWAPVWYKRSRLPVAAFVVRAPSETDARALANEQGGDETSHVRLAWLEPNYSTCTELSDDGPREVILKHWMEG